jgi:hypothetical protein
MKVYSHIDLAKIWLNYNGLKQTEKQIEKTIKQLSFNQLQFILKQRNLI